MTELIITSSVLILVVIILRHLLKGKISLRLQYALWALVLIRLIVPVTFDSPISVMNAVERSATYKTVENTLTETQFYSDMIRFSEMTPDEAREAGKGTLHEIQGYPSKSEYGNLRSYIFMDSLNVILARVLRFIWLAGAAVVGLVLLISNLSFSRKLKRARMLCQTDCIIPVYVLDALASPCLFGIFRPAIYITPEVAEDETKLRHVLAHEQTHYRHGDHIWSALRGLCLAVHWYNPLVWLAAALSRRDSELACDEGTIKNIGEQSRMEYGRTLIGLTCEKRKAMDLLCCATTMTDGKKGIKERITLIAKKPKILLPALIAVVLVAAVAVGCTFTGAEDTSQNPTDEWFVEMAWPRAENYAEINGISISKTDAVVLRYADNISADVAFTESGGERSLCVTFARGDDGKWDVIPANAVNLLDPKRWDVEMAIPTDVHANLPDVTGQVPTVYTREEQLGNTAVRTVAELLMTELLNDLKTQQDGRTFTITDWKNLSVSADRIYDAWVVTGDVEVLYEGHPVACWG